MRQPTAPIANMHKDAILDALQAARRVARMATNADLHAAETAITAAAAVRLLDRANALVVADQHDAGLSLDLSEVVVAMRDMAPTLADGAEMRAAADRLHLAAMLLFVARRERDLDARLREVLHLANGIEATAATYPDLNAIRRLARA